MNTRARLSSLLQGSTCRHAMMAGLAVTTLGMSTVCMSNPAAAQSVSDMLNSLFGQPQNEQRPRARQRQERPERVERPERSERSEPRQTRRPDAKPDKVEPVPVVATGLPVTPGVPQLAVVSLGAQTLKFYSGGKLIESSPISSGAKDFRTPTGVFSVIERHRDHESNIYESAPMPFMHRLTWSGIALHQGMLPGHPASHGCIRLPKEFVERLWEVSKIGMRVVVSPAPVEPVAVSSPLLFPPRFSPVPADIASYLTTERAAVQSGTTVAEAKTDATDASVKSDAGPAALISSSSATVPQLKLTAAQIAALKAAAGGATSLNPMQAGVVDRIRAQVLAPVAQKTADDALAMSALASAKANEAVAEMRAADASLKAAKAKVESLTVGLPVAIAIADAAMPTFVAASADSQAAATVPETKETKEAKARLDAQRQVLKAKSRLDAAIADEAVKSPAAFAAAEVARNALAVAEESLAASKVTQKRSSPISVLLSAKDKRLYVRQGLNAIFDAPVAVKADEGSIGTHVFQAVGASGEALNWVTVSVPTETLSDEIRYSKMLRMALANPHAASVDGSGKARANQAASTNQAGGAQQAAALQQARSIDPSIGPAAALRALARFELDPELTERLQELVWIGAWIIVSEQPLSKETGPAGTDLVVLTK
jgi:lipoprotein-anchoring transpeptidase ErfK/SrfK